VRLVVLAGAARLAQRGGVGQLQALAGRGNALLLGLQAKVDAFRTRKEAIKAAYTAAQAAAEAGWAEAVIEAASADIDGAGATGDETVNADSPGPARPSLQLSELRPGAPELARTRILFTVEPPGTAVLLAAGMESDWLRAWYTEAIANCRIRYQREQGGTR
jgi:hypothetical protein